MKKIIFCLFIFALGFTQIACGYEPSPKTQNERAEVRKMASALSPASVRRFLIDEEDFVIDPSLVAKNKHVISANVEKEEENPVPLDDEVQQILQDACKEFGVPYALALGLIEKESIFQNISGDNGASVGYMQIQKRWHWDRMERLGVTDLTDPAGNFRVGLDYLSELYAKYEDWGKALTVYNMGHDPGYYTLYAYNVLDNYAKWQELTGIDE